MGDTFHLLRLSLIERESNQAELDFGDQPIEPRIPATREEFLRRVFGERIEFEHRNRVFYYVPGDMPGEFIMARIGRPFETEENLAPDQNFESVTRAAWKAAVVVIDPRHLANGDGQKVAMHYERVVGRPFPVFASLVNHINDAGSPRAQYHIEVDPIFDPTTFWTFASEHRGDITVLTFDLATPNPFGGKERIEEELREYAAAEKAHSVAVTLRSIDGLETNTQTVIEAVSYAQRGAGKVTAKTRSGRRYDSTKANMTVTLDRDTGEPLITRAAEFIGRLLGRL